MNKGLYFFKDVLSGEYEFFGCFANDQIAIRSFKIACSGAGTPSGDLELYSACRYDSKSGRILHIDDDTVITNGPKFIMKGDVNEIQN